MKIVKESTFTPLELDVQNNLGISRGEIHLWSSQLDASGQWIETYQTLLTEKEKESISFFRFKKDQVAYIVSRGFLRLVLANYLAVPPEQVKIANHRKGKPYLLNDTSLLFNVSNSGNYVLIAISRHGEIGVDLERIRPLDDLEDLVLKNFSPRERDYITKVSNEKLHRFFKLWTLKEAFLKAIGEGMRLTPDNFEFLIENGNFKLHTGPGFYEFDDWQFTDINFNENYIGSLAHLKNPSFVSAVRHFSL